WGISGHPAGTISVLPASFRYFRWLPFCDTNLNPCATSRAMTSSELRGLGMERGPAHAQFVHRGEGVGPGVLEEQLVRLAQVRHRGVQAAAKTGHVDVEALGHVVLPLSLNDVADGLFHPAPRFARVRGLCNRS